MSDEELRTILFMRAAAETPTIVGVLGIDVVHMNPVRVFRRLSVDWLGYKRRWICTERVEWKAVGRSTGVKG